MVDEAEGILQGTGDLVTDLGALMHEAWKLKRELADGVTTPEVDGIYDDGIQAGALGGKLLGAGGGGFLLMYMKEKHRKNFFQKNPKLINVPFNFINEGTSVIFQDLKR